MVGRLKRSERHDFSEKAFELDPRSPLPLYHQVKLHIRQEIANGNWKPEQGIPSESELAANLGISIGTVRTAINGLVQEAVLYRKQGKGTFVANPDFPGYIRFFRFPDHETTDARSSAEVMSVKIEMPQDNVKKLLNLGNREQVIVIRRLRPNREKPIVMEDIFLPKKTFPNFDQKHFADDPVYSIYAEKYNVPVIDAHDYYTLRVAAREIAATLKVRLGDPVMFIERISYTYNNRPVEYRRCNGRGDLFRCHIALGQQRRFRVGEPYWERWSLAQFSE
jgi:GntR family transcriptional regulator